ncbi:hypothetical protein QQF64_020948 [Cirrhinus molitorella]|uniref:Uncharacterized protein n=1 Tax=Cirrhinus molitorella TaxID=172907 RepID=A0ABR3LAT2_9TELE
MCYGHGSVGTQSRAETYGPSYGSTHSVHLNRRIRIPFRLWVNRVGYTSPSIVTLPSPPLSSPCPQRFPVSGSLVSVYLSANPLHWALSLPHILSIAVSPPLSCSEPAGCHTTHTACYMILWKTELRVFVAACCCSSFCRLQSRRQEKMPSRQP